jgi:hypothetical protein
MGISLKDFASFAEGAIERDRELTKEDFEIRNANLAANRDMLIKQKEKKYEKELENYYKEKEKFDSIKSANAMFKDGQIDDRAYASQILTLTMPNFASLDNDSKESLINNFKGKTIDYSLKGSIDEINKNAAAEQTAINDATVAAIKEAKGDSFLINKILRKKGVDDKKLLDDIQTKINAAETVDLTEQKVDPSTVGLEVNVGGGSGMSDLMAGFLKDKNSDKYQDEWKKQRDKINFDLSKKNNNTFKFLQSTAQIGGSDALSYKYDDTDGQIKGMNQPAIANLNAMEYMFNSIKDNNDTMINHYYNVTKLHGNIGKTWNSNTIYNQMKTVLDGRGGNIQEGFAEASFNPAKLVGWGDNVRLTTFVPLSLVNQNNEFAFLGNNNEVIKIDKEQMKKLSSSMNNYIAEKALAIQKKNKELGRDDISLQSLSETVYERLYKGDKNTIAEFLTYDSNLGKNSALNMNFTKTEEAPKGDTTTSTTTTTIQDNKPKDTATTSTNIITSEGIKSADNGKLLTWEKIEETNQVGELTADEKAAYDEWKKSQSKQKIPFLKEDGTPKFFM